MTIPSHLPQFVQPARSGALQALALQAGQTVEAKVIGPAPNGGTQVEIRGQMLNLVMPTLVQAGATIRLEVQGTGAQLRLALQLPTSTAATITPAPAAVAPEITQPLPAALSTQRPAAAAQAAQAPAVQVAQPTPAAAPVPTAAGDVAQSSTAAPPKGTGEALVADRPPSVRPQAPPQTITPSGAQPAPGTGALPVDNIRQATATVQTTRVITVQSPPLPGGAPYPVASPALPNPLASAAAAVAVTPTATPLPQAAPMAVAPVQPAVAIGGATTQPSGGNPLPQPPSSPQAALAQMVHASIPRQGSITALTAALTSIAGKVALPEPVVRAAQQVLAGRVAVDAPRFDGAVLQAAIRRSGIFHEATLSKGQLALPQTDMKAALLTLRQTLTTWLGQQAPVNAVSQLPPPLRGIPPRARAAEAPPVDTDAAPEVVGRQLLERTESALARVRLHQHASLPDAVGRTADWSLDLPVVVGNHQTLLQIQIHKDEGSESDTAAERGWQMRFALNLPQMGEVGAQVTLRAGATGVMLWATEPAASAALEAEISALREALVSAGLRPGAVIVRHGEPPVHVTPAPSGHVLDASS